MELTQLVLDGLGLVRNHNLLEHHLVGLQQLVDRRHVDGDPALDHPFALQGRGAGLDGPVKGHEPVIDLLQQVHGPSCTVVALQHLATKSHARDLDLAGQRNLLFPRQQRNLPHLGQVHADRIVDAAGNISDNQLLLDDLVIVDLLLGDLFLLLSDCVGLHEGLGLAPNVRLFHIPFVDERDPHLIETR